jgi:hypothetical protein
MAPRAVFQDSQSQCVVVWVSGISTLFGQCLFLAADSAIAAGFWPKGRSRFVAVFTVFARCFQPT